MAEGDLIRLAQAGPGRTAVAAGGTVPLTRAQMAQAVLTQQGNDLLITLPNGAVVQVSGFFGGPSVPLVLADGAVVLPGAVAASIASGTPPLPTGGDPAGLPSSPVAPNDPAGGGLRGTLRAMTGDSLDALLGTDTGGRQDDAGSDLPPIQIASLGPSAVTLSDLVPSQRLPTEVVTNLALTGSGAGQSNPGSTTGSGSGSGGGGGGGSGGFGSLGIGLSRGIQSADSGNPGNASPPLTRAPQIGTNGDNTFDTSAVGTFNTAQYNTTTHSLNFNSGDATINSTDVVNRMFTTAGITFLVNAAPNSNDIDTIMFAAFPDSWFQRPVSDTYSGLAGNDTIKTGSGQDLLIGDYDLAGSLALTTSADDAAPTSFTPGNDSLDGGSGADTLYGGGGADTLIGGNGDDLFFVTDLDFASIDGGFGGNFPGNGVNNPDTGNSFFPGQAGNVTHSFDTLQILRQGLTIDLGQNSLSTKIQNIEGINLSTNGNNIFRATAAQIDSITNEDPNSDSALGPDAATADDPTDTLFIVGDSTDAVQLTGGGWSKVGTAIAGNTLEINTAASITFDKYTNANAGDVVTVYAQTTLTVATT
jgi:hypothetical protein